MIVAGAKPQEWSYTKKFRANALCGDAAYIISFASEVDVPGICSSFSAKPLFAAWVPDMFARNQSDLADGYSQLFPKEEKKKQCKKSVSESDTEKERRKQKKRRKLPNRRSV